MKKQVYFVVCTGLLAETTAKDLLKLYRKHKLKVETKAVPTFGWKIGGSNVAISRDYWLKVELDSVKDLMRWYMDSCFVSGYDGGSHSEIKVAGENEINWETMEGAYTKG